MFNKWPITNVIDLHKIEIEAEHGYDAFFSVCPVVEYRATEGYWLVLQTEHDYIMIGYDGVKVVDHIPGLEGDRSEYLAEESWPDAHDTVLFKGEHLVDVIEETERYVLKFDDFNMFLYPTEPDKLYYRPNSEYVPIHSYDRYIKRKCDCGGNGILMLDFLDDFFIRCDRCHKFAYASFIVQETIDDWNDNDLAEETYSFGIERFEEYKDKKIQYIALRDDLYCYDENHYECSSVMIAYEDVFFEITSHRTDLDTFDFDIRTFSGYNKDFWPRRIVATDDEPIIFMRKEKWEDRIHVLRLQIGKRPILIGAEEYSMEIGISHYDVDDSWIEFDDNKLLNDGQD